MAAKAPRLGRVIGRTDENLNTLDAEIAGECSLAGPMAQARKSISSERKHGYDTKHLRSGDGKYGRR
jgi:hypothetical protein